MFKRRAVAVAWAVLSAAALACVGAKAYAAMQVAGTALALAGAVAAVLLLAAAGAQAWQYLRHAHLAARWLLLPALAAGMSLDGGPSQEPPDAAPEVTIHQSAGGVIAAAPAVQIVAWGKTMSGYQLHPAFGSADVPDSLSARFRQAPRRLRVWLAKPPAALLNEDGSLTDSDGVSVTLRAYDAAGTPSVDTSFNISQEAFLEDKWISRDVSSGAGIHMLTVKVGTGAPGSTADFDTTYVTIQVPDGLMTAAAVGEGLLRSFALYLLLLAAVLCWTDNFRRRHPRVAGGTLAYSVVFTGVLLAWTYWVHTRSNFVYFWDFRNYWYQTEVLYGFLAKGDWAAAAEAFRSGYTADYSMLPAVLPALISLVMGPPTRLTYALSITASYAMPAYLGTVYLAWRMAGPLHFASTRWQAVAALCSALLVAAALPAFMAPTLLLMPDIGGVFLTVLALFSAAALVRAIKAHGRPGHRDAWARVFQFGICLGVLFSLMFLFRRWYVFSVAGIAVVLLVTALADSWRSPGRRFGTMLVYVRAAVVVAGAALPFLCWVAFAWVRDLGAHDYTALYSSYQFPLAQDLQRFIGTFGIAVVAVALLATAWAGWRTRGAYLNVLIVFSTAVAATLFLKVQSPGIHHFFLLMPWLAASMAMALLMLFQHPRYWVVPGVLGLCLVWAHLVPASPLAALPWLPRYDSVRPAQMQHFTELRAIARFLSDTPVRDLRYCVVASSGSINQGIFGELWQILPRTSRAALEGRLVQLGQVDSVDGAPSPAMRQCQLFIVVQPFQRHLRPGEQLTLETLYDDLVNGTGIAAALEPAPVATLKGEGVEFRVFRAAREITDAEYEALVRRYWQNKAAHAGR